MPRIHSIEDVIVRVYLPNAHEDDFIYQQAMMEFFYDSPKDLYALIKRKFGSGKYAVAKYSMDMTLLDWKAVQIGSKIQCDCSLQQIMIRGCQDPGHV